MLGFSKKRKIYFIFAKVQATNGKIYYGIFANVESFKENIEKHNKTILNIYVKYNIDNVMFTMKTPSDLYVINRNLIKLF